MSAQSDEQRTPVRETTEKDLCYSTLTQGHHCLHCGQMVVGIDGKFYHPDGATSCEAQEDKDCAPEGHSYAVYGSDQ